MRNLSQKINSEVARLYTERRNRAHRVRDERQAGLYRRHPELKALDEKLTAAGFAKLRAALGPPGRQAEVSDHFRRLEEERSMLLSALGIADNYLEPAYHCRACRDTGRLEGGWCPCRKQAVQSILPVYLPDPMDREATFSAFNLNLFEGEARAVMADYLQMAQIYTGHFDRIRDRNLFFTGTTGTGKTFLMQSIGHRLMDEGRSVVYVTAPNLFDIIMRYKRQQLSYRPDPELLEEAEMLYNAIYGWDLLLLDDLGTEMASQDTIAQLITLLDARQNRKLATIIASNQAHHKFSETKYDNRITSRLRGNFLIYPFMGSDLRLTSKEGR